MQIVRQYSIGLALICKILTKVSKMTKVLILFLVIFSSTFAVYTYTRAASAPKAYAATSSTLNFQGRLLSSSGGIVPDGTYNLEFKLYDAELNGSGANLWTESYTGGSKVRVVNGYFSVNLGFQTVFPGTINWDQELWLTMNVGGSGAPVWDGEMLAPGSKRTKLTAVPYAFKAGSAKQLLDTQGSFTGALSFLPLTNNRTINLPDASGTVLLDSTGFANGGNSFSSGTATLGTNDLNDLIFETNDLEALRVDQSGNVGIGTGADALEKLEVNGGIKLGNSTNTNAGTLRWTGADFEGYNGTSWVSLTAGTSVLNANSVNFVSSAANVAGTGTAIATGLLSFTSATAVSSVAGSQTFVAPSAGSFRTCLIVTNANRTAGTATLRWRVNGVSQGAGVCQINATNVRTSASSVPSGTVTFNAGDTITVALDTVGLTPARTTEYTVYWSVEYGTTTASTTLFQQNGNTFGTTATLGTTDNQSLRFITNNVQALNITNAGLAQFSFGLSAANNTFNISGNGNVTAGFTILNGSSTTNGTGTSSTTLILNDATNFDIGNYVQVASANCGGTGVNTCYAKVTNKAVNTLTVSPALTWANGSTVVEYNIPEIGGQNTSQNLTDRFGRGYFISGIATGNGTTFYTEEGVSSTASTFNFLNTGSTILNLGGASNTVNLGGTVNITGTLSGDGSGLTNIDASSISSGTVADGQLSSNIAKLDFAQTFTALNTFGAGLVLGNTTSTTAGAVRWTGSDFEGYNGSAWVSFTTGGGGGAVSSVNGLTGAVSLVSGSSGTDVNVNNSGSTITFNIPSASAANRGLVMTTDQTFGGVKTFNDGLSIATCLTSTNVFCQSGNTLGVDAVLGTNDSFKLNFETAGVTRLVIDASGSVGINTGVATITSGLVINTSLATSTVTVTTNSSLSGTQQAVYVNAASTTQTLPSASTVPGRIYTIKNVASGSSTTIASSGGNINGSTTYNLSNAYDSVMVQSDGTNWQIISDSSILPQLLVQAQRTTAFNLGAIAVLPYNNAITNVGSSYNTTTGIFTAPAEGTYSISAIANITMPATTIGDAYIEIYNVTGTTSIKQVWSGGSNANGGSTYRQSLDVDQTVALSSGQQISIRITTNSGGAKAINTTNATGNVLQITRLR